MWQATANIASSNQRPRDSEGGQKAAKGNQQAGNKAEQVAPLVNQTPTQDKPAQAEAKAQTEQPDPLQVRDVNAQEDMVFWAGLMFWVALATVFVTSLGTFLIWRQVKLTRMAVEDTSKATLAMERQNELAEDTAERQLRAYLSIGLPELTRIKDNQWQASFPILNTGQTPATEVDVDAYFTWVAYPLKRSELNEIKPHGIRIMNIGPHAQRGHRFVLTVTEDTTRALQSKRWCYYFLFQLHYTTFSGLRVAEDRCCWIARETEFDEGSLTIPYEGSYATE